MNRVRTIGATVACAAVLAGCAASHAATTATSAPAQPATSMSAHMTMPDGSIMGAAAAQFPNPSATVQPSASASMVCSDEVRADVQKVAALAARPSNSATFADRLYSCTYRLPMGTLVVSVKDLSGAAATTTYFTTLRHSLGNPADVAGLGEGAYGTSDGRVVLRKDAHVLEVDASGLPAVFGSQGEKRGDFAYEIASDILGCWTNG